MKPEYAEAHNDLGNTFKQQGRLDEALASYHQAVELKPDFAVAHSNLGIVLYMKGCVKDAIKELVKASDIDPELRGNHLVLSVLRGREAKKLSDSGVDDTNHTANSGKSKFKLTFLERPVEPELIDALYEMQSRKMDEATNTPVFGNGRCSLNYDFFHEDRPLIKVLEHDLIDILKLTFNSDIYLQDSFFNIYGAGAGIPPHTHLTELDHDKNLKLAKQKYSLVYYISVGDQDCSEPGTLKLYDPAEEILPCNGMIIIFPAGWSHSAIYGGKQ